MAWLLSVVLSTINMALNAIMAADMPWAGVDSRAI